MAPTDGADRDGELLGWTAATLCAVAIVDGEAAMTQTTPLDQLPPNLPVPKDDGGVPPSVGMRLPDLELPSTRNRRVNLSKVPAPRLVVYAYPMTGRPGVTLPQGWDDIPGARGCTLETCGFRDHHADLAKLQTRGLRRQHADAPSTSRRWSTRLKVPFEVLSDEDMALVPRAAAADLHGRGHDADQAAHPRSPPPAASSTCSIRCFRPTSTPRK